MLKVTSKLILSQYWMDEIQDVDWGDEDAEDRLVNENNLPEYLVDDLEKSDEKHDDRPSLNPDTYQSQDADDYRSEIPTLNENLLPGAEREIIYNSVDQLITDSINQKEVIGFDYINRHGAYAGWRTVEPHYTFYAYTTGNKVLVTWDRDVGDIRAFIVGNIQNNGVRYEGAMFEPKGQIMVGVT